MKGRTVIVPALAAGTTLRRTILLMALPAVGLSTHVGAVGIYSLQGVGAPNSSVEDINDAGLAVGNASVIGGFLWSRGEGFRDLGLDGVSGTDLLGRTYQINDAFAYGVNNIGAVTGYAQGVYGSAVGVHMPFVSTSPSQITVMPLFSPPGGWQGGPGLAINDDGAVAGHGQRDPGGGTSHDGFVWDGATSVTALTRNPLWSQANAINNNGMVAGFDQTPSFIKAFTWSDAAGMTFLGTDQGGAGWANDLNDGGEVVGSLRYYADAYVAENIATLWREPSDSIRLGDLTGGAEKSEALAINNSGQIVGWGTTEAGQEAFYWDASRGMVPLASLVDESLVGWTLTQATTINNLGWIGGIGINPKGVAEGFVLVPHGSESTQELESLLSVDLGVAAFPLPYSGVEPQAAAIDPLFAKASVWNSLGLRADWNEAPATDPKFADLVDSDGAPTKVTFSIDGNINSFNYNSFYTKPGTGALFGDYWFFNSRQASNSIGWRISGLEPGDEYRMVFYGSDQDYERVFDLLVDTDGDGDLTDEDAFQLESLIGAFPSPVYIASIRASSRGEIVGMGIGQPIGEGDSLIYEANWTGFQLARISTNVISEPTTLALFGLGLAGLGAMRRKKLAA